MEIVRLTATDCRLLCTRVADHGNSYKQMSGALAQAGDPALQRLRLLRTIERRFAIDLGSLCHRWQRRQESKHPLERMVLSYLVQHRADDTGEDELWVHVDRVREVRDVIGEGHSPRDGDA